jgi:hypothetical protein
MPGPNAMVETDSRIKENFDVSTIPENAMREISDGITSRVRFNTVVETGVPGFIPRGKGG